MTDNKRQTEGDRDGEGLKPCPFCASEAGVVQQTKVNWCVMCHACGAEGGWGTASVAIELWNARPAPEALCAAKGGLSDAEILDVASDHVDRYGWINGNDALAFARAILAKAKGEQA